MSYIDEQLAGCSYKDFAPFMEEDKEVTREDWERELDDANAWERVQEQQYLNQQSER